MGSSSLEIYYPPDNILKSRPKAVQNILMFLLLKNALRTPMASRLERLSFYTLLPKVRRAALPRQSAFLFAIAREKNCATPRNIA